MPGWLTRLLLSAAIGVAVGAAAAAGTAWWCLGPPEAGQAPSSGQLHVREGWCWLFADDRATGLRFYNLEREPYALLNNQLDDRRVPWWAEPSGEHEPAGPAKWRVGTLAVGWPWPALARQWNETELDEGFLPAVELDDDGSTIVRAAERFWAPAKGSRWIVLPAGAIGDIALFGLAAALVVFGYLTHRHSDRLDRVPA